MAGRQPLGGPLAVTVTAIMPVPASWSRKRQDAALAGITRPTGRPDADNLLKAIDGLNKIVWEDDAQIVDARILKVYGETPLLRIEASQISPFPEGADDSQTDSLRRRAQGAGRSLPHR